MRASCLHQAASNDWRLASTENPGPPVSLILYGIGRRIFSARTHFVPFTVCFAAMTSPSAARHRQEALRPTKETPAAALVISSSLECLTDDELAVLVLSILEAGSSSGKRFAPTIERIRTDGSTLTLTTAGGISAEAGLPSAVDPQTLAAVMKALSGQTVRLPAKTALSLTDSPAAASFLSTLFWALLFKTAFARLPHDAEMEIAADLRVMHFETTLRLGGIPVRIRAERRSKTAAQSAPLRGLPLFAAASPAEKSGGPDVRLLEETNWAWDSVMAGLSIEDAARSAGIALTSRTDRPLRNARLPYAGRNTVPGTASHLSAVSGSPEAAGRALCTVLVKACEILERRLDMARAGVEEGKAKEAALTARPGPEKARLSKAFPSKP